MNGRQWRRWVPGLALAGLVAVSGFRMATATHPAVANAQASDLAGTSWRLVAIQSMDDHTYTPDDGSKYTLTFGADSTLTVRADCNRGRGRWHSAGQHQVVLSNLALTRAHCGAASLHDRFVADLGHVRSYIIKDGHLFLSMMADAGILEFAPL